MGNHRPPRKNKAGLIGAIKVLHFLSPCLSWTFQGGTVEVTPLMGQPGFNVASRPLKSGCAVGETLEPDSLLPRTRWATLFYLSYLHCYLWHLCTLQTRWLPYKRRFQLLAMYVCVWPSAVCVCVCGSTHFLNNGNFVSVPNLKEIKAVKLGRRHGCNFPILLIEQQMKH